MQALLHVCGRDTRALLSYRRREPQEEWCFRLLARAFAVRVCPQEVLPRDMRGRDMWVCELRRRRDPADPAVRGEDVALVAEAREAFRDCGWLLRRLEA